MSKNATVEAAPPLEKVSSDSVIVLILAAVKGLSGADDVWEACEEPAACMGVLLLKRMGALRSDKSRFWRWDSAQSCPSRPSAK